jgi:signal peptidase
MLPTLKTGDLVVLQAADSYQQDDVVAFHIPAGEPGGGSLVIHRIIGGSEADGFVMRGDNKDRVDDWRPMPDAIVGHLWVHLPGVGAAVAWMRQPAVFAPIMAGFVVFFILMGGQGDQKRRTSTPGMAAHD